MHETYRLHAGVLALLSVLALCACGAADEPSETMSPWPLTIESAVLSCEPAPVPANVDVDAAAILREHGGRVFVTAPDGRRFAVNGTARSEAPPVAEIQATFDLRPLIERGLALCAQAEGQRNVRLVAPTAASSQAPPSPTPPTAAVTADPLGGRFYTIEANQLIDGRRPKFTLACEAGVSPMVLMDLARAPQTSPPLRGVYAEISVDDAPARRYELAWGGHGEWSLRSGDDRTADRRLAQEVAAGERLTFTGAGRYMPAEALTFDFHRFGQEERAALAAECR